MSEPAELYKGPHSTRTRKKKTKIISGLIRTYAKIIIVTRQTQRGKRHNLRCRFVIGVLQQPAQANWNLRWRYNCFSLFYTRNRLLRPDFLPPNTPIAHHVVIHVPPISSWLFCALFYSFKLCPYILRVAFRMLRGSMSIAPSFWSHLHRTTRSIASAHSLWSPPQRNSQPPAF